MPTQGLTATEPVFVGKGFVIKEMIDKRVSEIIDEFNSFPNL